MQFDSNIHSWLNLKNVNEVLKKGLGKILDKYEKTDLIVTLMLDCIVETGAFYEIQIKLGEVFCKDADNCDSKDTLKVFEISIGQSKGN